MIKKYKITNYTKQRAKELNVIVKPSENINKKIDVFTKENKFLFSIGSKKYKDYPNHILENGIEYANQRKLLYKLRHYKDINNIFSKGWYTNYLLW
jgi:hypothetical protein